RPRRWQRLALPLSYTRACYLVISLTADGDAGEFEEVLMISEKPTLSWTRTTYCTNMRRNARSTPRPPLLGLSEFLYPPWWATAIIPRDSAIDAAALRTTNTWGDIDES